MEWLKIALIIVAGYFLGNISAGIIISNRVAKIDIRDHGSKNSGATNMFRILGAKASLLTLIGDALKGSAAALLGLWLLGPVGSYIGGISALVGHMWPVLHRFKGGKGVATALGVAIVVDPIAALIMTAIAFVMIFTVRVVSVASLIIMFIYSAYYLIFHWGNWPLCIFAVLMSALIYIAHRSNIKRILSGTEFNNKLDFSKAFKKKNS